MKENTFAILGMGAYGRKIADSVRAAGHDIIVADSDPELINSIADRYTYAVSLDMGNADAVAEIGLQNVDIAVVDLPGSLEQAIICVMVAKEQGVSNIIATATNSRVKDILKTMGANDVVIPAEEAAMRMARTLISEGFMEYIDIGKDLCVIKIHPLQNWIGKSIADLDLRNRYQVNILAVEEDGAFVTNFDKNKKFNADSVVLLGVHKQKLLDFIEYD